MSEIHLELCLTFPVAWKHANKNKKLFLLRGKDDMHWCSVREQINKQKMETSEKVSLPQKIENVQFHLQAFISLLRSVNIYESYQKWQHFFLWLISSGLTHVSSFFSLNSIYWWTAETGWLKIFHSFATYHSLVCSILRQTAGHEMATFTVDFQTLLFIFKKHTKKHRTRKWLKNCCVCFLLHLYG